MRPPVLPIIARKELCGFSGPGSIPWVLIFRRGPVPSATNVHTSGLICDSFMNIEPSSGSHLTPRAAVGQGETNGHWLFIEDLQRLASASCFLAEPTLVPMWLHGQGWGLSKTILLALCKPETFDGGL
jgi:hypothetical protein